MLCPYRAVSTLQLGYKKNQIMLCTKKSLFVLGYKSREATNVERKNEARSRNNCRRVKAISIKYLSVCVCDYKLVRACVCVCVCVWMPGHVEVPCACTRVAFLIQNAPLMHHIVSSFVAPLAPSHVLTLFHKRQYFREKVTKPKICSNFLYKFCLKYFLF
jgi:hypothetical protein